MKELKKYLNRLGACSLKGEVDSLESAVRMMFTPQGREFCMKTDFPTIGFLRRHKNKLNAMSGVFVDCGKITLPTIEPNRLNLLISGSTSAILHVSKPNHLHKVIVAHNAKLTIHASDYAVLTVAQVGDAEINVINDGTANVTIERENHG